VSEVVSQIGTFTTDTSLIVRTWDAALVRLTGIAADGVVGRPLADVMPNLRLRGLLTRFQDVVETGAVHVFAPGIHHALLACPPLTPSHRFEQMQQRVTVAPLRRDDRITGVMGTIEDVTPRIEAERDLAEALATAGDDWVARRAIVEQLPPGGSADFAHALVEIIRTHHRDFGVLSGSLQLLAGTDVDVSESLTELLHDPDADLRVQAALALGRQPSARAEDALLGALADPDMNVRFQAIESLGQIRAAAAVDRLVAVAQSDEVALAFAAVDALAAIRSPGTAEKLAPLLARDELRLAVVHALGVLGDESAVAPLIAALNEFSDMTLEVADAVDRVYRRLERRFAQGAAVAHVVKTTLTESGAAAIVAAVRQNQKPGRSLTRLLGWVGTADARAALVQLLGEPTVRQLATEMLPAHGESVVELLLQQLESDNDELRHAAIALLGNIGDARASAPLIALLPEAPQLATVVVGALARIADPASFEALLGLLAHPDAGVRQPAVGALNAIGHPDLPSRVNLLLQSSDPNVRESALKITGYFAYPAAYPRVLELTADPVEQVRCAAIESLPYFEDTTAVATLTAALAKGVGSHRSSRLSNGVAEGTRRRRTVGAVLRRARAARSSRCRGDTEAAAARLVGRGCPRSDCCCRSAGCDRCRGGF
jgi:HEAT repeat protein